jgi:anthranilate phosphoribosyltransferase
MRIKGETPEEMAGFLEATRTRTRRFPAPASPAVVLPSYNGARKLPVLTPLLALLLARRGLPVLVHGHASESSRVFTSEVLEALGIAPLSATCVMVPGEVVFAATGLLCPGLERLLDVRRIIGLRNPAHSVVKLMNPCEGRAVVVSSYTHPEYAVSMAQTFELTRADAMLLRGTEGEAVADARRMPQMDGFIAGSRIRLQEAQPGPLASVPSLPRTITAAATASYIESVLAGSEPIPEPIARQVEHIVQLVARLSAQPVSTPVAQT